MDTSAIQQELFHVIRSHIPEHVSAAEEIANVLQVSVDSVYRRMRGEKRDHFFSKVRSLTAAFSALLNNRTEGLIMQLRLLTKHLLIICTTHHSQLTLFVPVFP